MIPTSCGWSWLRVGVTEKRFVKMNIPVAGRNATTLRVRTPGVHLCITVRSVLDAAFCDRHYRHCVCTRVTLTVWFSSYYYYVCYTSIRVSHRVSHESGLSGVRVSQAVQALSHISRKATKAVGLARLSCVSHTHDTHARCYKTKCQWNTRRQKASGTLKHLNSLVCGYYELRVTGTPCLPAPHRTAPSLQQTTRSSSA